MLFLALTFNYQIWAQKVEFLKSQEFKTAEKINGHRYGGISGLSFSDGFIWAISDDRGQYGTPRIYKHSIKNNQVKIENEILVKEPTDVAVVDYEALYRFKDGKFLISSEGDFNKKPRALPFVRVWSEVQKWLEEILLPVDFMPEKIGMQTKGLQNNSGFEALAVTPDEKTLYVMSENPLYQNQNSEIEFLEYYRPQISAQWSMRARKTYLRNIAPEGQFEVMRGISEILYWKKDSILVLERWVRLNKSKAIVIGAELFSVNLLDLKKKKLFTFDGDLAANWEGLSWGPDLSDGRKLLILVSDNNFERSTPTQFLFLAFNEKAELKP